MVLDSVMNEMIRIVVSAHPGASEGLDFPASYPAVARADTSDASAPAAVLDGNLSPMTMYTHAPL
jgi:hypothetical protein